MAKTLVKVCKNGTKVWEEITKCDRCGGAGRSEAWRDTGLTCYKCGGSGRMIKRTLEYTPEHEAELMAQRKAKAEKRAAEQEAEIARREALRLAEEIDECHRKALIENERFDQRKAEAEHSEWMGQIKKKLTVRIVSHKTIQYEVQYGYYPTLKNIHIMKDAEGNVYKWSTENGLEYLEEVDSESKHYYMSDEDGHKWDYHFIEDDEAFTITGTVKEHTEYEGVKQTVLTRCKVKAA